MVKKVMGVIAVIAVCAVAGWNYQQSKQSVKLSDLALENIEALADPETGEEFTEHTGCVAVMKNVTCRGKDGFIHTYATRK